MDAPELRGTALWAAALLAAVALLFFGSDFALGRALLFSNDMQFSDFWHLHYPLKHFYAEALGEGRLAQWCHLLGTGVPLHAMGEVGMLYPPNLVLFALLPLPLATNLSILLHFVLAGVLASCFARQLGASRSGALLAGLAFAFSAFFVAHARHMNLSAVAAWMPGLLLFMERYWRRRRALDLAALATIGALCLLAGHPQLAYNHALVAAGYGLYLALRAAPTGLPEARGVGAAVHPRLRFPAAMAAAAIVAGALGAPQLLPSLELHREGPRQGGLSYEYASEFDLHPAYLLTWLQPHRFGRPDRFTADPARESVAATGSSGFRGVPGAVNLYWEVVPYLGILPLLLAAWMLVRGRRRRDVQALAVLALLSVALSMGRHLGIGALLHHWLPGYDLFRFHPRFLLYANLAIAVLAGLGLSELQRPLRAKGKSLALALGIGALLLLAGDLYLQLGSHNSTIEAAAWSERPQSLDALAGEEPGSVPAARLLSFDPQQEVFLAGYLRSQGWSAGHVPYEAARNLARDNYNVLFGVPQAEFYLPLYPQRARAVTESLYLSNAQTGRSDRLHEGLAELFNVGHVLASERGAPEGLEAIAEFPGKDEPSVERIRLHRLPAALPRAFLVGSARVVTGAGHEKGFLPAEQMEALLAVTDAAFDPRAQLVIDRAAGEPLPVLGLAAQPVAGTVEVTSYQAERVRLDVDSPRDAWLFLSDTWYPGWRAWVDGEPATLYPANVAGRAVRIAAGQHVVELRFQSRALRLGLALALGALLALLVFVARSRPGIP
jgi:hypothetical protein